MKNFKIIALLLATHLISSQNIIPTTGQANLDTSLKIGNQVTPYGVGQITGYKSDLESQTNLTNRWHGIDATITAGEAADNKLKFRLYAGSSASLEPNDVMVLVGNGNVGIGIPNPNNKLDVNGTIHSKEVKVDMTGWSDFVFKKEYNLPTLEQIEKHIAEKGHLENIPNEEEVLNNGINLGEMNSKLLQKIEELTLYLIEQNKKTEELKTFISDQNKVISEQNKRLEKLENKQ